MLPRWPDPGHATPADLAACRALLRDGSRTFFAASRLLPPAVRAPASALYAFCRVADDAVDRDGGGEEALAILHERLAAAYAGCPWPSPVDRALADVVREFAIPRELPEALLEGLAWDAAGRRYATLGEVHAYAVRVAGTVGLMMALVMGVRSPSALTRACDLGVAMQLSNIARDVGEDARAGRLYLPLRWLRGAGIEPDAWLARPEFDARLAAVVQRLLVEAERLYRRAGVGIDELPPSCRTGIHAARLLYAEIGREVQRAGLDSVSRRAVVPLTRKLWLVLRAIAASLQSAPLDQAASLPEARFLLDAIVRTPPRPAALWLARPTPPWWRIEDRFLWVLALFDQLERREQAGRSATGP